MELIEDLGMLYANKNKTYKKRYGIYKCPKCEKHFKTTTSDVKRGKSTQCKSCKATKHGKTNSRLYIIWEAMKQRCKGKTDYYNKHYKNKGVQVCKEWENDFKIFEQWSLNNGYKDNLSIDRIDNDGNYEPNNCRWTTQSIQMRNTRKLRSDNSSGYRGVYFHKSTNKFLSRITVNGKVKCLGYFKCRLAGAYAYDEFVFKNNLEHTTNFNNLELIFSE